LEDGWSPVPREGPEIAAYSRAVSISVARESMASLGEYERISIAFEVSAVLDVAAKDGGLGGLVFVERRLAAPYVKDYDALPGEGPATWARRFDLARWALFAARDGERLVGGAVVAHDTPGVDMLEGRTDLVVLWDIRVESGARRRGVGRRLFAAAIAWARERGCRALKVETQNVNVAACRFYARQGCVLRAIDRFAYPELPDEVQLLWQMDLTPTA
jgi:GNAT superfamily N-acetyltransferase